MHRVFQAVTSTGSYQRTPGARGALDLSAEDRREVVDDMDDGDSDDLNNLSQGLVNEHEIGTHLGSTHIPPGTTSPPIQYVGGRSSTLPVPTRTSMDGFPHHASSTPPLSQQGDPSPPFPRAMPRFPGRDISGNKRKTPSSGSESITSSMNRIVDTIANKKPFKQTYAHGTTMVDVMKAIREMEIWQEPPHPPVYWWFLDYLTADPMRMEIFVGIDPASRIDYIDREWNKATQMAKGVYNPADNVPEYHPLR